MCTKLCTEFRQNVMNFRWGICNMATVCHLRFSKFKVRVTWPLWPCYSACMFKFYWNRTIGCGVIAKNDVSNGRCPPSSILKIFILAHVTVTEFQICWCIPNFIEIGWFLLRYDDLTIFKMADLRHLEFYGPVMVFFKSHVGLPMGHQ